MHAQLDPADAAGKFSTGASEPETRSVDRVRRVGQGFAIPPRRGARASGCLARIAKRGFECDVNPGPKRGVELRFHRRRNALDLFGTAGLTCSSAASPSFPSACTRPCTEVFSGEAAAF